MFTGAPVCRKLGRRKNYSAYFIDLLSGTERINSVQKSSRGSSKVYAELCCEGDINVISIKKNCLDNS